MFKSQEIAEIKEIKDIENKTDLMKDYTLDGAAIAKVDK